MNDQSRGSLGHRAREEATSVIQGKDDECLTKSSGAGYGEQVKLQDA